MAARQQGLITLDQLRRIGLSASGVRSRVEAGRLHPLQWGVFAVGHKLGGTKQRWRAAVLACGPGAVLSHRSAAALWGIGQDTGGAIDVTASNRRGRSPRGIAAHRDASLAPQDRFAVDGIPCTTVSRTLLDAAAVVSIADLHRAVSEAEVLRLLDPAALRELVERSPGRRGVARLRALLEHLDPRISSTQSELERRFVTLCERAGLPSPEVNERVEVRGGPVVADFLWREACLIVEADGRRYHGTASAFERDRRRDQLLQEEGWRVVRCTWGQVVRDPAALVRTLHKLIP